MKIGVVKTIVKEEITRLGESPPWIDALLGPLNQFITAVGTALKGNLTFADNFLCVSKTLKFTHDVEQEINPNTKLRVTGMIYTNTSGLGVDVFKWQQKSNGNVGVTFSFSG